MGQGFVESIRRLPGRIEAVEAYWRDWLEGALVIALDVVYLQTSGEHHTHPVQCLDVNDYEVVLQQKRLGHEVNWPEVEEVTELGRKLAVLLGVPFNFASPHHPELDCPRWWERDNSVPCLDCGVLLKQQHWCPNLGLCWFCHTGRNRREFLKRQPLWDPELDQ
jgi:hypothetical protein